MATTNHLLRLRNLMYLPGEYSIQNWNNEFIKRKIDSKAFMGNIINNKVYLRSKSIAYWPKSIVTLENVENGSKITITFQGNFMTLAIFLLLIILFIHYFLENKNWHELIAFTLIIGLIGFFINKLKKNVMQIFN